MKRTWIEYLSHKQTIGLFLFGCLVVTAGIAYAGIFVKPAPFKLLDWLINYEAGFVRRGLLGQVLMEVRNLTGISLSVQVFVLQVISYSVFFGLCYALIVRIHNRRPFLLLIYSPFLFVFQIADWLGGFRKEILFFCVLAYLAWMYARDRDDRHRFRGLCVVTALYPLLILTHEAFALYMPYLLFFVFFIEVNRRRLALLAVLGSISVAASLSATMMGGTPEVVAGICESIASQVINPALEGGCTVHNNAIGWLDKNTAFAMKQNFAGIEGRLSDLGPLLVLAGVAYLPLLGFIRGLERRARVALTVSTASAILLTLVLFVVTIDWGRWIYIHLVAVSIMLFHLAASGSSRMESWPEIEVFSVKGWMVPVYLLSWNLDHWKILVGGGLVYNYLKRFLF